MRELFEIAKEEEVRLWQRYMTNSYELLTNHTQTLADAGIYGGQVGVVQLFVVLYLVALANYDREEKQRRTMAEKFKVHVCVENLYIL